MDTISRGVIVTVVAAAISAALVGCGTQVTGSPAPAPAAVTPTQASPAPVSNPQDPRQEVEDVFHRYYEALLTRDFATACAFNAPETTDQLIANVRTRGATVNNCEDALGYIYAQPGAAQQVDAIVRSATVQQVQVNGDSALITWTAGTGGQRPSVRSALRRIDNTWKLVDTGA